VLSASLAQEIARDISAVIGFNVLITDGEGIVIGSGDVGRVGSFHEASVEVMATQELATHTSSQAQALRGVKPGITLPLVIDGQAVGTVGITGAPDRVRRFGLVVRRQTEILLQESAQLRSRLLRERALEDLLRDIASYDAELVEPDQVRLRATELGYDLTVQRVVVVLDVTVPSGPRHRPSQDVSVLRSELLRTIREVLADLPSSGRRDRPSSRAGRTRCGQRRRHIGRRAARRLPGRERRAPPGRPGRQGYPRPHHRRPPHPADPRRRRAS